MITNFLAISGIVRFGPFRTVLSHSRPRDPACATHSDICTKTEHIVDPPLGNFPCGFPKHPPKHPPAPPELLSLYAASIELTLKAVELRRQLMREEGRLVEAAAPGRRRLAEGTEVTVTITPVNQYEATRVVNVITQELGTPAQYEAVFPGLSMEAIVVTAEEVRVVYGTDMRQARAAKPVDGETLAKVVTADTASLISTIMSSAYLTASVFGIELASKVESNRVRHALLRLGVNRDLKACKSGAHLQVHNNTPLVSSRPLP